MKNIYKIIILIVVLVVCYSLFHKSIDDAVEIRDITVEEIKWPEFNHPIGIMASFKLDVDSNYKDRMVLVDAANYTVQTTVEEMFANAGKKSRLMAFGKNYQNINFIYGQGYTLCNNGSGDTTSSNCYDFSQDAGKFAMKVQELDRIDFVYPFIRSNNEIRSFQCHGKNRKPSDYDKDIDFAVFNYSSDNQGILSNIFLGSGNRLKISDPIYHKVAHSTTFKDINQNWKDIYDDFSCESALNKGFTCNKKGEDYIVCSKEGENKNISQEVQKKNIEEYRAAIFDKNKSEDCKNTFELTLQKSNKGDVLAQYQLGTMYRDGQCVKKDAKKAISFFEKAAAKANVKSQISLGDMYFYNWQYEELRLIPYKETNEKAAEWYKKAVAQNNIEARYDLGRVYCDEDWTEHYDEGFNILKEFATNGYARAQFHLGSMYDRAQCGQKRNFSEMIKWYSLSAENGNSFAQDNLNRIFHDGRGEIKDIWAKVKWKLFESKEFHYFIMYFFMGGFIIILPLLFGIVIGLFFLIKALFLSKTLK